MLVHRDNDEKSDDDQPALTGRPNLSVPGDRSEGLADGSDTNATEPVTPSDDDGPHEEGKTHMIGDALKSVYQRTLEEDIPDDFLDLLKQLK